MNCDDSEEKGAENSLGKSMHHWQGRRKGWICRMVRVAAMVEENADAAERAGEKEESKIERKGICRKRIVGDDDGGG